MSEHILTLAKNLISLDAQASLELVLSYLDGFTIERFENEGVKSALVYNTETRPELFKLILNGHLDVIPGKKEQYVPRIEGDKLFGVGAMDMKANVACMAVAFRDIANNVKYPVGLQLTTDEEVGGYNGTKYQIDTGVKTEFVLAGEPTNFDIVHKAKGILWIKVSATGKTAHGAYPWRGENAIWKMNTFLNALQKDFPIPEKQAWISTVNLSSIETTNATFNKIPDNCSSSFDIRYIPEDEGSIIERIKKLLPNGCTMEVIENEPAMFVKEENEYIQRLREIGKNILGNDLVIRGANGSSDARHYITMGAGAIEFGPIGDGIGGDNEYVSIPSLHTYYQILKTFLVTLA